MSGGWKSSLEYPWPPKTHIDTFSPRTVGWRCWIMHILGFFPLGENIQPSRSVPEHPKAFSIFMFLFFFFRMDTVKSQEGPGVLDLFSQGEEMWIKCLVKAKKRCV